MIKFLLVIAAIIGLGIFFKTEPTTTTKVLSVISTLIGVAISMIKVT